MALAILSVSRKDYNSKTRWTLLNVYNADCATIKVTADVEAENMELEGGQQISSIFGNM